MCDSYVSQNHNVLQAADLAAAGSLAFNTWIPASHQGLPAASTRCHFVQQAENGVDSKSPQECLNHTSAGSVFPHFTWIIETLLLRIMFPSVWHFSTPG